MIPSSSNAEICSWDPEFGKKPVRIIITGASSPRLATSIRESLEKMRSYTRLDWDFVDKGDLCLHLTILLFANTEHQGIIVVNSLIGPESEVVSASPITSTPMAGKSNLVEMLDIFKYAMEKANCRYREGRVFKFVPESLSTYDSK